MFLHVKVVTILILIDGFLQFITTHFWTSFLFVTILILIDGFLQYRVRSNFIIKNKIVTILILIDGFLQLN